MNKDSIGYQRGNEEGPESEPIRRIRSHRLFFGLVVAAGVGVTAWGKGFFSEEEKAPVVESAKEHAKSSKMNVETRKPKINLPVALQEHGVAFQAPFAKVRESQPLCAYQKLEGEKAEAAAIILYLSPDDLDRMLRGSRLREIPKLLDVPIALRELQAALRGYDLEAAKDKAARFLQLVDQANSGEGKDIYIKLVLEDPSFSEEFKTILVPARESAEILLSVDFKG